MQIDDAVDRAVDRAVGYSGVEDRTRVPIVGRLADGMKSPGYYAARRGVRIFSATEVVLMGWRPREVAARAAWNVLAAAVETVPEREEAKRDGR